MFGLMQDQALLVSSLIVHADRHHGDQEIVSRAVEGPIHRYNVREAHQRICRLAWALQRLGVVPEDRIGTLAWNGHRHFELYFAVSGIGSICHTINPRLFHEQLVYIVNHAEDRCIFFDATFAPIVERLIPCCPTVRHWVAMGPDEAFSAMPNVAMSYEALLAAEADAFDWPQFDERTASSLCYTSGTTGHPKGVLYSHRSTILHSYAMALPDSISVSARDSLLPVVPMFHVNAWGLPYVAMLTGAKLVFPGAMLDGKSLYELAESEAVTFLAGVPTIWLAILDHLRRNGLRFTSLRRTISGGSALPPAMIRLIEDDYGVEVLHGWGMTELSPVGTIGQIKRKHQALDKDQRFAVKCKAGRAVYGVDIKIVDEAGTELPWDGKTSGELLARGWWVACSYFKGASDILWDGWFPTGDIATIDADGYVRITDRAKDLIKSGGEWISSIELENIAIGHPAVAETAVIGISHPKWAERPLLIAQLKPGATVTREELLSFIAGKVAKWWVPDDVAFVDTLPHTATGKLLKTQLRLEFADYRLPGT